MHYAQEKLIVSQNPFVSFGDPRERANLYSRSTGREVHQEKCASFLSSFPDTLCVINMNRNHLGHWKSSNTNLSQYHNRWEIPDFWNLKEVWETLHDKNIRVSARPSNLEQVKLVKMQHLTTVWNSVLDCIYMNIARPILHQKHRFRTMETHKSDLFLVVSWIAETHFSRIFSNLTIVFT